jgi:hypothetical protein
MKLRGGAPQRRFTGGSGFNQSYEPLEKESAREDA